jgi:alkanesulfonate monooxygenase SsuD/methylene tetrahydromethanopterin reductase-like flavin-dependent oxidoreductase (luciferase family)
MAARYADGFNVPYLAPEAYKERLATLDQACEKIGRDPREIARTINLGFYMGADAAAVERNRKGLERFDAERRTGMLSGNPQQVIDRLGEYERAGAEGVNIAFRAPIDWDAFEAYIEQVLPVFHT